MIDLTVTITDEQVEAMTQRLTDKLWRYNHRSRIDDPGEHEVVLAPAVQLTNELAEFVVKEALILHHAWSEDR